MLAAGSCQKEVEFLEGDTVVKFEVSAGDVATKAIADASNITVLHWELYGTDIRTAAAPYGEGKVVDQDGDKNFTVELRLVADQDYNIVFWAETEHGATHYDTQDLRSVKIKTYGDENANDESRAAFFAVHNFQTENGVSVNEQVTLYRPFAQINLGTTTYVTDLNQINGGQLAVETTQMTVTKIANVFNTLEGVGEVVDFSGVVTFKAAATPNGEADKTQQLLSVNENTYYWIGMNYLIVEGDSDAIDVDVVLNTNMGTISHSVANVPVKENYRTNILGDFLTTGATFEIVVDETFQTPEIILGQAWSHLGDFHYVINEGAPAGTLKAVLAEADAEARALATKAEDIIVTIDLASDVDWVTEASHGSSPLLPAESPILKVAINGNGKTLTATGAGVGSIRLANRGVLEFKNVNIVDKSVSYNEAAWELTYLEFAGALRFEGCTFNSGIMLQSESDALLLATFQDCHFISNEANVYSAWVCDGIVGFNECTFKGTRGLKIHEDYGSEVVAVLIENCEFGPIAKKPGIAIGTLNADTEVYVSDSKFIDCQAGDQGLYMYETDTDVDSFDFTRQNNTVISATEPVVQEDGSVIVACAAALQQAVAAEYESVPTIKLVEGTYEGVFFVKQSLNLEPLNEGRATINGKLAIAAAGKTVNVKNLVFENSYTGSVATGHQYVDKTGAYCIGLYCASVNVDGCTFNLSKDGGINFYAFNAPDRCTVTNTTFNANGCRPIISKANLTVDGCTFNDQYKYSVQVWGNQNNGNEQVVFTNNTINNAGMTSGCADIYKSYVSVSKSYPLSNVAFTISGNTAGYSFVYDNHANIDITSCSLNDKKIVEGQCYTAAEDVKAVVIDYTEGDTYVGTSEELNAAVKAGVLEFSLMDGTYTLTSVPAGLSLVGVGENVVLDVQNKVYGVRGAVSFENVTLKYANANYKGFQHTSQESYKNCTIVGQPFLYGETVTFEGCTFEQESANAYNVWTYGAKNVTFDECTFNCAGKSVLVYAEGSSNGSVVTFDGCKLNASAPAEGKAAIEIDSSLIKGEYVVNINETEAEGFANGNVSGNSLWNNKKGTKTTVFVDGAQVL